MLLIIFYLCNDQYYVNLMICFDDSVSNCFFKDDLSFSKKDILRKPWENIKLVAENSEKKPFQCIKLDFVQ